MRESAVAANYIATGGGLLDSATQCATATPQTLKKQLGPVGFEPGGEAGIAVRVQTSSTTDCPESKAATIVSKDDENAAINASFRQLPSRTHSNRPASLGWLVR